MSRDLDYEATGIGARTSTAAWLLGGALLFALGIRIYYLVLTHDQPVWWDEAEYLVKARALALGTPDSGFFTGRPLLLSLIMAGVYAAGMGELAIRVGLVVVSTATVYLTYRVGVRIVGQSAALIATALFSVYSVQLFYSYRVMTEIPSLALALLGVEFFLSGERRKIFWSVPMLVLAALTRFPAALMFIVLVLYDVSARRGIAVRSRQFLISTGLGGLVALPFLIWKGWTYGDPLHEWHVSTFLMPSMSGVNRLQGLRFWASLMWHTLGWALCGVAAARIVAGGLRPAGNDRAIPAGGVLIAYWIGIISAYFCLTVRPLFDRYFVLTLPAVFMWLGEAIVWCGALPTRDHRRLQTAVTVAGVVAASLWLLRDADRTIRRSMASYAVIREVGEWLKETTAPDARIMSQSVAQLTYYSERTGVHLAPSREAALSFLQESKARYLVLSQYELKPDWLLKFAPQESGFQVLTVFHGADAQAEVLRADPTNRAIR